MGQQQSTTKTSKHSNNRNTNNVRESKTSRIPISIKDIEVFNASLRNLLNDPIYAAGIKTDSVIDMINDISSMLKGNIQYVHSPLPLDGNPPVSYIRFKDGNNMMPCALNVGVKSPSSRRSQNYNLKYGLMYDPNTVHTLTEVLDTEIAENSADKVTDCIDDVEINEEQMSKYEQIGSTRLEILTDSIVDDLNKPGPGKFVRRRALQSSKF